MKPKNVHQRSRITIKHANAHASMQCGLFALFVFPWPLQMNGKTCVDVTRDDDDLAMLTLFLAKILTLAPLTGRHRRPHR